MKKIYVADDGMQFTNEIDCINYEESLKKKSLYAVTASVVLRIDNLPISIEADSGLCECDLEEKILETYDFKGLMELFYENPYSSNGYVDYIPKLTIDAEMEKGD